MHTVSLYRYFLILINSSFSLFSMLILIVSSDSELASVIISTSSSMDICTILCESIYRADFSGTLESIRFFSLFTVGLSDVLP